MATRRTVEVGGRHLRVSNLDKVLYPAAGFTKAHVLDYYLRIAPVALPHLRRRPLTMRRWPDGVSGESFFEKRCPDHRPDWVGTATVPGDEEAVDHCTVDDAATLAWVANLASLELHTSLARAPDVAVPTAVVFDLDPGPPADATDCAFVALRLRDLFAHLGLVSVVKTSGQKGLQVYVPLNTPARYEDTRGFSRAVAGVLARAHPDRVVATMSKQARVGKVYVDWAQNHLTRTTVAVYSLRATARPAVSAPLAWDEVEGATAPDDLAFEAADVLARVGERGDLFAAAEQAEQELPRLA